MSQDTCKHCEKELGAGYICDKCETERDGTLPDS